ncbi:alcohol oxidase [Exidia glandulosa HHB12029]|uniref:Alcohol oxidase n=1 Tax=Exidia glandulosa HHB12029 TaxID=1314781 RepID=A0A165CCD2_EXIGL|nr:alcohol oxidase [Exidia glandulosa HHB12029]
MPIVSAETFAQTSFDYIVVGGGTAGLVVAARLSEDPGVIVGIIEAGEYLPDREDINVPGYFGRTIGSDIDWKFETVPQPGLNGRKILMSRGKVLGGTSAVRFSDTKSSLLYADAWEKLGMSGWNWHEILRYMCKAETTIAPSAEIQEKYSARFNPECHGSSGPLISSYPNYVNDKHTEFLAAVRATGLKENLDPDNGHNVGAWTFGGSIDPRTATRSYAATAYWAPNADRTNLLLVTSAHALKVTFAPSTSAGQNNELCVAQGVQFTAHRDGAILRATAKRAIILSAGAIQTPQLLERSGIGNPAILREYDIECVVDLPGVGENLQDHIYIPMSYEVTADCDTWDDTRDPSKHAELWAHLQQKGKYSHMHSAVAMAGLPILAGSLQRLEEHLASATRKANGSVEDYAKQHALLAVYLGEPGQAQAEIIQAPGFASFASQTEIGKRYHSHINIFLRPFSRGHVHIASSDPHAAPSIDPRYFSHPLDFDLFMDMVRYSRRLMRTDPIAGYFVRHVDPGSDLCDAELEEHVRQQAATLWHPVGTAAMLPREENVVVDQRLRVYGTANLHVVDASVIPIIPACHPQQTIYAIGEKVRDNARIAEHRLNAAALGGRFD